MSIQQALVTLIFVLCAFLSVVSFLNRKRQSGAEVFSAMSLLIGFWAVVTFFEEEAIPFGIKHYLVLADFSIAYLISFMFFIFIAAFTESKQYLTKRLITLYVLAAGVVILAVLTNNVVASINPIKEKSIEIIYGIFNYPYTIALIANFILGGYIVLSSYRKATNDKKSQLKYIATGLVISAIIATATNVIIPQFFDLHSDSLIPRIGIYSISIFLTLTTIALSRYKLFNTQVIATQLFVGLLLFVILARVLTSNTTSDLVAEGVVFLLSSIVGYYLVRSVRDEVTRREEIEKLAEEKTGALTELEQRNKNLAVLQKVSEIVMNESDMLTMTQDILNEFPKQMDGCIGGLLTIVKDKRMIPFAFTQNELTSKVSSLIGTDVEKYAQPLTPGYNGIHDCLLDKKPRHSDSITDFISPPIPKPIALTLQRLIGAKHFEAIPLYAGGEPFGVMLFVFASSEGSAHDKNIEIATSISNEMSLAVQRAQAFQKLKEANEYLKQLDKMKDEFISMASHELNTPLAAIEGYLSMILDEGMGKVDAKSKEYLSRAYASSKRLADLILDLLNVSRIEQGRLKMKFAQSNMVDLAESVTHELQIKSDAKKIYLKVDGDKAKVPLTWCDPDRIRQVLVNLAGNAIKFTEKGGVTIHVSGDEKFVHVAVSDTGRGIAKEDQKLLFNKFSQVKREVDEHQGTGLGLYISKNYVELHNGKIWVESEAGKGATFKFDLPVIDKPPLEVKGAVLEQPVGAPQISVQDDKIPDYIVNAWRTMPDGSKTTPSASAAKPVAAAPAPLAQPVALPKQPNS